MSFHPTDSFMAPRGLANYVLIILTLLVACADEPESKTLPELPQPNTVMFPASIDTSKQPMLMVPAKGNQPRPLLVALHTWSGSYDKHKQNSPYQRWCAEQNWHYIYPDFRGPNKNPKACGSDYAVQDILDAVAYMKKHHEVDSDRVYLMGVSGGAYAALLMAGRAPEEWAGVSAWAPIADLQTWWIQRDTGKKKNTKYARDIEAVVSGRPDKNPKAAAECKKRSAITYMAAAKNVSIDINAGNRDGRGGSVPFTHSFYLYNELAFPKDRFDPTYIEQLYDDRDLRKSLPTVEPDPLYGGRYVILRRQSQNVRLTLFKGGHEIIYSAGLNWLAHQRRNKPTVWTVKNQTQLAVTEQEHQSGL